MGSDRTEKKRNYSTKVNKMIKFLFRKQEKYSNSKFIKKKRGSSEQLKHL